MYKYLICMKPRVHAATSSLTFTIWLMVAPRAIGLTGSGNLLHQSVRLITCKGHGGVQTQPAFGETRVAIS